MRYGYDSADSVLTSALLRVFMHMRNARHPRTLFAGLVACLASAMLVPSAPASAQESAPPTESAPPSESPAEAPVEAAPSAAPAPDPETYGTDLRTLEERVNSLKERVFRSKARLVLLRETVLNGVISGARARVVHRNEMGASFVLQRVSYTLDGEPLFNKTDDDGTLDGQSEIELFEGSIVPGTHNLSVSLLYRGNGYGVFTYLRDYTFKLRASYPFTAEEGKLITVKAVAFERGGITTDLQDRPSIRFETRVKQDIPVDAEASGDVETEP